MVVGVCRMRLVIPTGRSLKAKRSVLNRIKDRVRHRFNVAIAEVGSNDLWRRIDLGLAVTGNDGPHVQSQLSNVQNFIVGLALAELVDTWTEVLHFNDGFQEGRFTQETESADEGAEEWEEPGADDADAIDAGDLPGDED
jgi:uncharacterized protein YlxP (DUF503 family)